MLATIQHSSWHLLGLIDSILNYVKTESDEIILEAVDFSLAELLGKVKEPLLEAAAVKGIEIVYEIDPRLPVRLKGNPLGLGQILGNLLDNAIKFSEKGRVTLRVDHVAVDGDGVTVRFEVADQGIGISPDVRSGLFRLFTQGDNSLSSKYGGIGLGLAFCKRLVTLMGGGDRRHRHTRTGKRLLVQRTVGERNRSVDHGKTMTISAHWRRLSLYRRIMMINFLIVFASICALLLLVVFGSLTIQQKRFTVENQVRLDDFAAAIADEVITGADAAVEKFFRARLSPQDAFRIRWVDRNGIKIEISTTPTLPSYPDFFVLFTGLADQELHKKLVFGGGATTVPSR